MFTTNNIQRCNLQQTYDHPIACSESGKISTNLNVWECFVMFLFLFLFLFFLAAPYDKHHDEKSWYVISTLTIVLASL